MCVSLGKQRLGNFTRGKKKHLSFFLKRSWSLHKVWYNFSAGHSGILTSHLLSLLCISTLNSDSVILIICSSSSWVKPFSWARFSGKCAWGKANPKGTSAWAPDSKTRSYFSESQAPKWYGIQKCGQKVNWLFPTIPKPCLGPCLLKLSGPT